MLYTQPFFHPKDKVISQYSLTLESDATDVGTKDGLIVYKPDSITFIVTRMRLNFKSGVTGIENTLLTAKRNKAELDIFTELKLGVAGSALGACEPLLDLDFSTKETFIELSNSQNLLINAKTTDALSAKTISLTLFGYKIR